MTDVNEADSQAFRAAIAANPADATARLVYADWLDEAGRHVAATRQRVLANPDNDELRLAFADALDESAEQLQTNGIVKEMVDRVRNRAEFVRVQVELAKTPKDVQCPTRAISEREWMYECRSSRDETRHYIPIDPANRMGMLVEMVPNPRWEELRKREGQLWHTRPDYLRDGGWIMSVDTFHEGFYLCLPADRIATSRSNFCIVHRGFVGAVSCTWEEWRQLGDQFCYHEPVSPLRLTTRPKVAHELTVHRWGQMWLEGRTRKLMVLPSLDNRADARLKRLLAMEWPTIKEFLSSCVVALTTASSAIPAGVASATDLPGG